MARPLGVDAVNSSSYRGTVFCVRCNNLLPCVAALTKALVRARDKQ